MNYLILLFGVLIALISVVLLLRPAAIFGMFEKHANSPWLHFIAVTARIILGTVLIIAASESRFPAALLVLGWISIIAALVLIAIGRERFKKLIDWAIELAPAFKNVVALIGILLGGFLIYAVL